MTSKTIQLIILALTLCMGATGCSSLGDLVSREPARCTAFRGEALSPDTMQTVQKSSKSVYVYNSNPYMLSLDVEEMEQDSFQTPVSGDGGVSLNAYAACLTLKVMF